MSPAPERARAWMTEGTEVFDRSLAAVGDEALQAPTALQGWTGRHLLAHVAANADALRNLVRWASTGQETPMYSSSAQRDADIEQGAGRPPAELREWYAESAAALQEDLAALTPEQWQHEVRTAQGRTVPATEVPWMRAREVMVHAVDLGAGTAFTDLPEGFLADLVDDVVAKRSATPDHPALSLRSGERRWQIGGQPGQGGPEVSGPLAGVAAYLTGRADERRADLTTQDGAPVPDLPRWL